MRGDMRGDLYKALFSLIDTELEDGKEDQNIAKHDNY